MQDPNPLPWGAQDRFQAHLLYSKTVMRSYHQAKNWNLGVYVVLHEPDLKHRSLGSKKVVGVTWEGGKLAEDLNADSELNEMIVNQSVNDAIIFVDPTDNGIRIYGKWKNSHDFGITKELFDIYNNIAGYIKKIN